MSDQVKTRQTKEEAWRNSRTIGSQWTYEAGWNAALESVIMPETMNLSTVQRYHMDNDGEFPLEDGEWIKYSDVAGKIPVQEPVPSAGGLTEKWLRGRWEGEMSDSDLKAFLLRNQQDMAATEARVRAEQVNSIIELQAINEALRGALQTEQDNLVALRAQLAAKPNIDVKNWPDGSERLAWQFIYKDGHVGPANTIYRPQPRQLTPEEMAKAWCVDWSVKSKKNLLEAKMALLDELINGRTIAELYAETVKEKLARDAKRS